MQSATRVAVIGAGSWGTALAIAFARRAPVLMWARDPSRARAMQQHRVNAQYLPDCPFPESLSVVSDLGQIIEFAYSPPATIPLLVLGVPLVGLEPTVRALTAELKRMGPVPANLVWTCKGLHGSTGQFPHEVVRDLCVDLPGLATGVLSGPSFAREVAAGLPVALTIASGHTSLRKQVTAALHGDDIRVYGSIDVLGVELGGAMKNVLALACGIADGMELGMNARAALITRGLAEMTRLGLALGAQASTFAGLTGLGDLVLTATGHLSRNRQVGVQIGQGIAPHLAHAPGGQVAEGVRCARQIRDRARAAGVSVPIVHAVCQVLDGTVQPAAALRNLMQRDPRDETAL